MPSPTLTAPPITPVNDRILIRVCEKGERVSPGGVVIPMTARPDQMEPIEAVVVAVGPGNLVDGDRHPPGVTPGERLLCQGYCGHYFERGGEKFRVIQEHEILGKIPA